MKVTRKVDYNMSTARKLQILYLKINRLQCIPSLHNSKYLEYLGMSHNQLGLCEHDFEYKQNFLKLGKIYLYNNSRTILPGLLRVAPNLKQLYLANNMFTQLPNLLKMYRSLCTRLCLHLEHNPIECDDDYH